MRLSALLLHVRSTPSTAGHVGVVRILLLEVTRLASLSMLQMVRGVCDTWCVCCVACRFIRCGDNYLVGCAADCMVIVQNVIILPPIVCCAGHSIYHTGDTDVFGDMKIISDLYKPDVALICIGGVCVVCCEVLCVDVDVHWRCCVLCIVRCCVLCIVRCCVL